MTSDSQSDIIPRISTDGGGTWVVAWETPTAILIARSVDNGGTWSLSPSSLAQGTVGEIVALGAGVWVLLLSSSDDMGGTFGSDADVFSARSNDDGLTWATPIAIDSDATADATDDTSVSAAIGPGGSILAAWSRDGFTADTALSNDQGVSWLPAVPVAPGAVSSFPRPGSSVAATPSGEWVVAWSSDYFATAPLEFDLVTSRSVDGAAWSSPTVVNDAGDISANDKAPSLTVDTQGRYILAWQAVGKPLGGALSNAETLLVSRSVDGGGSWSSPAALLAGVQKKALDLGVSLAYDGNRALAVYTTRNEFTGSSEHGDSDIGVALATFDCPLTAEPACIAPTVSRGARVKFKNGDHAKDSLAFSIGKGDLTTAGDVGTPDSTSKYVLCQYDDQSGGQQLILEKDMPAGETCKNKPCWKSKGPGDYQYKDGKQEHGAIKSFRIRADVAGKTKLKIKAKGPTLGPPIMPLQSAPAVTFQVHNLETGVCWSSTFSSPDSNTAELYKAKSD